MEGFKLVGVEGEGLKGRPVGTRLGARVGCLVGRREGELLGAAPVGGEGAGAVPLPVLLLKIQFVVQLPKLSVWKAPVSGMR